MKRETSKWAKQRAADLSTFHWQNGYGAFSGKPIDSEQVIDYIYRQPEHHARMTFQEEFRTLCGRHNVQIDERYVWDWSFRPEGAPVRPAQGTALAKVGNVLMIGRPERANNSPAVAVERAGPSGRYKCDVCPRSPGALPWAGRTRGLRPDGPQAVLFIIVQAAMKQTVPAEPGLQEPYCWQRSGLAASP